MYQPSLEEARRIASSGGFRKIPVSREILSDFTTPIEALRVLRNHSGHCFLLESAEDSQRWGRYTFLGYEPRIEVTCTNGKLRIRNGETVERETSHPGAALREIIAANRSPRIPGQPPFTGGLVGYFSYDYIKYAEPSLTLDAEDEEGFQDMDLMLFDREVCFDNFRQKLILIANADAGNLDESYPAACAAIDDMAKLLRSGEPLPRDPGRLTTPIEPLFDETAYCAMVEKGKRYIREGDVFQVVLSNRLSAGFEGSLLDTYRVLRTTNPSPYMFYFTSDDI